MCQIPWENGDFRLGKSKYPIGRQETHTSAFCLPAGLLILAVVAGYPALAAEDDPSLPPYARYAERQEGVLRRQRVSWARAPLYGSWEQTIKDSSSTERDDAESTVEGLLGTSQNFHIYHVDTQSAWEDFQTLLEAAKGTELKLFAGMSGPNLSFAQNRWYDSDGSGDKGEAPPKKDCGSDQDWERWDCERDYIDLWLELWVNAAAELSALSLEYPDNFVGLVLNDAMVHIESVDFPKCLVGGRLTKDDLQRIYDACHSSNPAFGFYPAITYPDLGRLVSPGHVLGATYGCRMRADEWMAVRFDVPLLPDPVRARLSFFHTPSSVDTEMMRSVSVAKDGYEPVEIWSEPLYDASTLLPSVEHTSLSLELDPGHNLIELRLSAVPSGEFTNPCGGSGDLWYVFHVKLEYWIEWNGGLRRFEFPLSARYATNTNPDDYPINAGCSGSFFDEFETINNDQERSPECAGLLSDDDTNGFFARRLLCGPNHSSLIQDVVDGVVPYISSTDSRGADDALDPSKHFRRLLRETRANLPDDLLIAIHTALVSDTVKIDPDVMLARMRIAAATADAVGVYRYPLGMYFMDASDRRGLFAEPPERGGTFTAQWPSRQAVLPGWYQRWVHQPPAGESVEMQIELWDNRSDYASPFRKRISGGGLLTAYEIDPWSDGTDHECVPLDGSTLISTEFDPVIVELINPGSQTVYVWMNFNAFENCDEAVAIPATDWNFESGIDDANTTEIYERVTEFFNIYAP